MTALIAFVPLAAFVGLLVYGALSDLLTYTIPNRISLMAIALFVVFAPLSGLAAAEIGMHLAAFALVLTVAFAMFAFGWIGGGDAKLAAVTALWLGFSDLASYLVVAALAGGALTLAILALRMLPVPVILGAWGLGNWAWLERLHDRSSGIPYGIALAGGALVVLPSSRIWSLVFGV